MPALTEAQLEQFNREGFLVVEDIYDKERDFGPIMAEYSELLGSLCEQWYSERGFHPRFKSCRSVTNSPRSWQPACRYTSTSTSHFLRPASSPTPRCTPARRCSICYAIRIFSTRLNHRRPGDFVEPNPTHACQGAGAPTAERYQAQQPRRYDLLAPGPRRGPSRDR